MAVGSADDGAVVANNEQGSATTAAVRMEQDNFYDVIQSMKHVRSPPNEIWG